jgi:molybdopterin molybdotransferase
VRQRAEDVAKGQVVLPAGTRLGPAQIGLAASLGHANLAVRKRPVVALFSTGDELIAPGSLPPEQLPPGAIYNSNRYFLASLLKRWGAEVLDMGAVADTRQATLDALQQAAAQADLIVTSGGVGVGEEDHIKPAVQALGELNLWQISMKPGKPFAHGVVRKASGGAAHFMGLPGNPVSSFVTAMLLVRPFLQLLQGMQTPPAQMLQATALQNGPKPDKRREFLRGSLVTQANGSLGVTLFANQNSSVLTSMHASNVLVDNPSDTTIHAGDTVNCLLLNELL